MQLKQDLNCLRAMEHLDSFLAFQKKGIQRCKSKTAQPSHRWLHPASAELLIFHL